MRGGRKMEAGGVRAGWGVAVGLLAMTIFIAMRTESAIGMP
jgi:hypothetical protein